MSDEEIWFPIRSKPQHLKFLFSAFSSLMQITSVLDILQLDVRRALHKVKWVRQAAQAPKALLDG